MKISQKTIVMVLAAILLFAVAAQVSAQPVVESIIVGKFTGLKKGNVYNLQNGQIWKQTELWTQPKMLVRPAVTIHKGAGGAKMTVEGFDREVAVERLK